MSLIWDFYMVATFLREPWLGQALALASLSQLPLRLETWTIIQFIYPLAPLAPLPYFPFSSFLISFLAFLNLTSQPNLANPALPTCFC